MLQDLERGRPMEIDALLGAVEDTKAQRDRLVAGTAALGLRRASGKATTSPPFRLNMAVMVNSRAIRVTGPMRGRNRLSYQSAPLRAISTRRVRKPPSAPP